LGTENSYLSVGHLGRLDDETDEGEQHVLFKAT